MRALRVVIPALAGGGSGCACWQMFFLMVELQARERSVLQDVFGS